MNNTINKILKQYEANKKQYSSINLSNIMSMLLIKRAINLLMITIGVGILLAVLMVIIKMLALR